jgi:hypothetical protein
MWSRRNRRAHEKRVRAPGVVHMLVALDEVRCEDTLLVMHAQRMFPGTGRSGAPQRGLPFIQLLFLMI